MTEAEPDQEPIDESIGYLISRAATDMRVVLDRALAQHGISSAQWVILARVARKPPVTPAELSDMLHISRPAITGLVDRMVEGGYVERCRSELDGRSYTLSATASARKLLTKVPPVVAQLNDAFTRGLSKADKTNLRQLLRRVIANVDALDA